MSLLQEATEDFVQGKGGATYPNKDHCTVLIKQYDPISNAVKDALHSGCRSLSVMPYGDQLVIVKDPVYLGSFTTTVSVTDPKTGATLNVHFDRN